jgi:hypothetical protein
MNNLVSLKSLFDLTLMGGSAHGFTLAALASFVGDICGKKCERFSYLPKEKPYQGISRCGDSDAAGANSLKLFLLE